jgi:hypothetical protein
MPLLEAVALICQQELPTSSAWRRLKKRAASAAQHRFRVKPAEAWKTVVLNRWRVLCPQFFDDRG